MALGRYLTADVVGNGPDGSIRSTTAGGADLSDSGTGLQTDAVQPPVRHYASVEQVLFRHRKATFDVGIPLWASFDPILPDAGNGAGDFPSTTGTAFAGADHPAGSGGIL